MKTEIKREGTGGRVVYRSVNEADVDLRYQTGASSWGWDEGRRGALTGKMGEFSFCL